MVAIEITQSTKIAQKRTESLFGIEPRQQRVRDLSSERVLVFFGELFQSLDRVWANPHIQSLAVVVGRFALRFRDSWSAWFAFLDHG